MKIEQQKTCKFMGDVTSIEGLNTYADLLRVNPPNSPIPYRPHWCTTGSNIHLSWHAHIAFHVHSSPRVTLSLSRSLCHPLQTTLVYLPGSSIYLNWHAHIAFHVHSQQHVSLQVSLGVFFFVPPPTSISHPSIHLVVAFTWVDIHAHIT